MKGKEEKKKKKKRPFENSVGGHLNIIFGLSLTH
jgi:hypothetical protein